MTISTKAVAIRNKFTDELQAKRFYGRDYAAITQRMKKWLGLTDETKWSNDWRTIAVAELRSIQLMRKIHWNNRFVAKVICFAACKSI